MADNPPVPPSWATLIDKNRVYVQTKHKPKPYLSETQSAGLAPPSVFIIGCIDPRASPEQYLDLEGDEAFVSRNLGGRFPQSIEDLLYIEQLTKGQAVKEVIIMHHTDCGMTHLTESGVKANWKAMQPQLAGQIDALRVPTYDGSSLEKHREAMAVDLEAFKASPLIRQELKDSVKGYLLDIKTGKLTAMN
ncbi:carbonic anhydrase [Xylariaceae sp. FL1272]|nr:carbonic anhydrase [Xylariaceae sp. FL1272]